MSSGMGRVACCLVVQKFKGSGEEVPGVQTGIPGHRGCDSPFRSVPEASTLCGRD